MSETRCPRCGASLPGSTGDVVPCPRCLLGLGLAPPIDKTLTQHGANAVTSQPGGEAARFLPGQLLLGRYRIVAPLGRGGMGEVYRADDLKLGEPVALKFLPWTLERNPALLARLLNEVKVARKISHPNVCRVFDVEEVDGQHFLSMEYVDGEDLASLLRRIGRLPRDGAVTIARQLFAGLAAAHRSGILHRDIKPANVMIDGHGRVRLMDFGLAQAVEGETDAGRAGTPAYMAPEQLDGRDATERTDLYSLGVLLYEMFTGRHPLLGTAADPETPSASSSAVTPPSMHVRGLHRRVEDVILGCLQTDPARRPASAEAAAASLPLDDPIAAHLAARQTPPPDVVASALAPGGLRRRVAWVWLIAILVQVAGVVWLSSRTQITRRVPLDQSRDVLREKAREILVGLGYAGPAADELLGFDYDPGVLEWGGLDDPELSPIHFWYRRSPAYLVRLDIVNRRASYDDPPWTVPGMIGVRLDPQGRLRALDAVPAEIDPGEGAPPAPAWNALIRLAGFEPAEVEPAEPAWVPPVFADQRRAWRGAHPADPSVDVRLEAAAWRGTIVGFRVHGPWVRPGAAEPSSPLRPMASNVRETKGGAWARSSRLVYLGSLLLGLVGGLLVARSNVRAGRGHNVGALRIAGYLFLTGVTIWALGAHHVPTTDELKMFIRAVAVVIFWSLLGCVFYVAVEPYLRRFWPRTMVSWIRLIKGRFRDPLVGRDLLVGCTIGIAFGLLVQLYQVVPEWIGLPAPRPDRLNAPANELEALRGMRHSLASILTVHWKQAFYALLYSCVLVVMKLLLRRTWLTVVAVLVLGTLLIHRTAGHPAVDIVLGAALAGIYLATFFRLGLLTVVVAQTVAYMSGAVTITPDLSSWYAHGSVMALAVYAGLAIYGFHTSLAGRGMFGDALVRD